MFLPAFAIRIPIIAVMIFYITTAIIAQQTTSLNVIITDQNLSSIPNVNLRLKYEKGLIKEVKNSDSETNSFSKLLIGKYILEVEAKGFKPYSQEIEIKLGKNEVKIKLEIAEIVENIDIGRDAQDKATDPREGAFTNFLTKAQLENLPEDPEELEKALKEQFGQDVIINVDGFTGGKLPKKSEIASIRVTRSSFDAEYHQLGSTIIDIVTKAGSGRWSGSFSFNFNDKLLNARNPFSLERLGTQQRMFDIFLNGPIIKNKTSFSITTFGNNSYRQANINAALPNAQLRNSVRSFSNTLYPNIKISHNLGKVKTLNVNYSAILNNLKNSGVGGFNLTERAFDSKILNQQIRISESGYIGKRFLNEIRFQFTDEITKTIPVSNKTAIIVFDAFSDGGAGNRNKSNKKGIWISDNLLFGVGNILSVGHG